MGDWEEIGFVPGFGTTTEPKSYSFIDDLSLTPKLPSDRQGLTHTLRYRLKQIDFDGTSRYSEIVEVEIYSPAEFSLEQNYPNPFNPSTKIKFTIPSVIASEAKQSQLVTLKIYDILGNEVATLVNEEKPAGTYEVEFNTSSIKHQPSSGIYFYKLQVGSYTQIRKMTLLK
ncbi:MAG: T9SS type A sorting domain-containing protein [Ignavibacteriaceae bacterium]|nr:T9SS type A sorting domain-containing protein [Ignavibacteriaceae bacterium]